MSITILKSIHLSIVFWIGSTTYPNAILTV